MQFEFQENYIAFLDILGFRELLRAKDFKEKIEKYFKIIDEAIQKSTEKSSHGIYPAESIKKTVLSDSIILSIPVPTASDWTIKFKSLRFLLSAAEKIQYCLALENIWIRGGISQGELSRANNNIIGQGLVSAYLLEGKASFPRVLVDSDIFRKIYSIPGEPDVLKSRKSILNDINNSWGNPKYSGKFIFDWAYEAPMNYFNQDYPFFIHYLNPLLNESSSDERKKILEFLIERLHENDPEIYKKYRWVSDYLRSVVEGDINRRVEFKRDELFETEEGFQKRKNQKFLEDYAKDLSRL